MQKRKHFFRIFLAALAACTLTGCAISSQAGNQTAVSDSASAPGQTNVSGSASAPGQTDVSGSASAGGQTDVSGSGSAEGQTAVSGSASAEGQTDVSGSGSAEGQASTKLHVLDVGQGLSVLVESGGHFLLYDGGDSSASSFVVSYLKQQDVSSLDYVIASHYDADHLNGVVGALHVFPVGQLLSPDYATDTRVFRSFEAIAAEKKIPRAAPAPGTVYSLGNASFQILAPSGTDYDDVNNNSIAIRLWDGDQSVLITGDAEHESEEEMLATGLNLDSDIYVLGHHGSASSSSWDLLKAATPEAAVLSCGAGNSYGHPHEETMERLESMEIDLYRTDKQGTLIATLEDSGISWNVSPCNDYTPGDENVDSPQTGKESQGLSTKAPASSTGTAAPDSSDMAAQDSAAKPGVPASSTETADPQTSGYVLNTRSKKIHRPTCDSVAKMSEKNKEATDKSLDALKAAGYEPCQNCKP